MIYRLLILFSFTLAFIIISCSPQHSDIVLAEYAGKEINMDEFEEAYAKNAGGLYEAKDDSLKKLKNFLDLYLNFKMKLRDAEVRGYENNPQLNEELLDYKKKIGVSYLLEKEIIEPGVKDLYDKRKWDIRVSHLMIRPDSTGEEAARNLANAILDSIKQGAIFEEMVQKHSDDNFSLPVGGDIYYVTAGMLPAEFENAAYETGVGEVYPEVVQTKFGFHIIKVADKKERVPQIKASHILVDFTNEEGEIDSAAAKARIDSVAAKIKSGEDFALLAAQYSDDSGSKEKGGDLGYFERRQMVKEFDEAAFNLDSNEVSDIIKTNFGYHIIKLTDKKQLPSYEEERESLKKIFQETRYQQKYDNFIDSLKVKYNYQLNEETVNFILDNSDSVMIGNDPDWIGMESMENKELFSYAGKKVTASKFLNSISENNDYNNKLISKDLLNSAIKKISGEYLLEEEALNLEKNNKEFADLMNDYKNGIFIFKLQDDEVWSKIDLDSTKLYNHYLETKENYVWSDRVSFSEIYSRKDSLINHYHTLLKQGADFDSLAAQVTERPGFKEKSDIYGLQPVSTSQLTGEANKLQNPGDFSEPFNNSGGFSIIKLNEKEASRIKTFEEAKAEVSGSLQDAESKRLDQAYLDTLKKRYEPVVYYEKLNQAFTEGMDSNQAE